MRGNLTVDVLAPDGLDPPPTLDGKVKAIGVPGGSQALARAETVAVRIGERRFVLRCPVLLGAVLLKARSLLVHDDPETQRDDLLRLLSLVEDPRAMAAEVSRSERRWLQRAAPRLAVDHPANLSAADMRRARQSLQLLLRSAGGST
jgi:hypothetical protein